MPSQKPKVFAQITAGCVFLVGVMALLGWAFDIAVLKSVQPGWPKVAPITALAFLLASVSLWCAVSEEPIRPGNERQQVFPHISQGSALAVAAIGLYRLCDYIFGWNLNLDMLGFTAGEPPTPMVHATALGFLLMGSALYFSRPSRSIFIFLFFILAAMLVSSLGLLRYLYGGEPLLPYSQMSAITAFCFLVLSSGIFCSRTDGGLMALLVGDSAGGLLARWLLPPAMLVPFVIGWLRLKAQQAGWFGTEAGLSIFALSNVIVFGALVWVTANLLHRTDSKRKHEETRYRTLFDTLIEGFCTIEVIFDANGKAVDYRFLEVNPAFEKQTGMHNAQGKLMRDFAPDHEEYWFEMYGKVALTGEAVQFENEAKALGRYYDVYAYRVGEPESRKVAILFNDITKRKQVEAALRESEEYFRFLNDLTEATRTLADPAQIMDVTARMLGEHLRVSRCAYADVEVDGDSFTILHDYTDGCASTVGNYRLSLFGARAVTTLQSGQTLIIRDTEKEISPDEGLDMFNAIGIQAIITCPLVKDGVLRAMMAVHQTTPRDWKPSEITIVQDVVERCWATIERRTAEEKLYQLNIELEQRVALRTAELETANKELEAFSYSVSHDLRAPLRAVDGFSLAVLEDFGPQLPEEGRRQLQVIRNSAQRMGELIDDLLAFSRLSRQPLRKQKIMTEPLVRAILVDMRAQCEGRQIEIKVGKLPPCEGDSALLNQVWVNLISNAIKYSGKCERAIVEIGCTKQKGTNVYFVRDNGSGFDMQYANKLFGVFQRLHRVEDYPGTGVGLAIVQRIVHRHGGRIWAEAAIDQGATFYFTLEGETNHD